MSDDSFSGRAAAIGGPARTVRAVAPSDASDLPGGRTRGLYVGGAGVVMAVVGGGAPVRLVSGDFQYHPLMVSRILATGTTATEILAIY